MTDTQKRLQQIEHSRTWITHALLSLMEEKPFHEITISEVTKRADLSRRTFYRHFHSLDEVLETYILELRDEFFSLNPDPVIDDSSLSELLYNLFSFWEKHHAFLKSARNSSIFFSFAECIFDTIHKKRIDTYPESDTLFAQYSYCFISTGLWNMLVKWASDENPATPQEMTLIFLKIIHLFSTEVNGKNENIITENTSPGNTITADR